MSNTAITFFLPGLLGQQTQLVPNFECTALAILLSKAVCIPQKFFSWDQGLRSFFTGLDKKEIPSGALSALAHDLIARNDRTVWLRADPIECYVDHRGVYVLGNEHLKITDEEKTLLISSLNSLLEKDSHRLIGMTSHHWVCTLATQPDIVTNALYDVMYLNMAHVLPSGPDATYWNRLITECQMLLKSELSPSLISSLWFWGLGKLPEKIHTPFSAVFSSDLIVKGLAKCANIMVSDLPVNYDPFLIQTHKNENLLFSDLKGLFLMNPQSSSLKLKSLQEYEENWFKPCLKDLEQGKIERLSFHFANGKEYIVKRKHLKYFWRRARKIENFLE